jgi:hypothetical protein
MKKTLLAGMLMVLLAAALFAGCSQQAVNPPGPKQPAVPTTSQTPPPEPALVASAPATIAPADNGTETAAAPPAVVAPQAARVGDILQDPKGFDGKTVIVEGKIASECPSGCWFTLKDGNATIYIDLNPSNLVIPQRKGSYAKVTAKVIAEGSDVYLIGTKVDF